MQLNLEHDICGDKVDVEEHDDVHRHGARTPARYGLHASIFVLFRLRLFTGRSAVATLIIVANSCHMHRATEPLFCFGLHSELGLCAAVSAWHDLPFSQRPDEMCLMPRSHRSNTVVLDLASKLLCANGT